MNIYSYQIINGTVLLIKQPIDFINRKHEYESIPNVFINPQISFDINGHLKIFGKLHSFVKIRIASGFNWVDVPLSLMNDDYNNQLFVNDVDIYKKKLITWFWTWKLFFRKRTINYNVPFIRCGWYLSKEGVNQSIKTSNFRIVEDKEFVFEGKIKQ